MTDLPASAYVPHLTLGWKMRMAMEASRKTVQQMADLFEVSESLVRNWTHDRGKRPSRIVLKEWALVTGVNYAWLAGDGNSPPPPPRPRGGGRHRAAKAVDSKEDNQDYLLALAAA